MSGPSPVPVGTTITGDIEHRPDRPSPYRARIRWSDPTTGKRPSKSAAFDNETSAQAWIDRLIRLARSGVHPDRATMTLEEYGESVMSLAMLGLEPKTLDPYLAGWRRRIVPTLGHLPPHMITEGVIDRAVEAWIVDGSGQSTIKNSLAALVRVMEQARRDALIDRAPTKPTGWQHVFKQAHDELWDPRALALPDWETLDLLANALVARSAGRHAVWGDVVRFCAATGCRIGEASGSRAGDLDTNTWIWTVRRQTTPSPGGLADKGTKGNRAREVPLIPEIRGNVLERITGVDGRKDARLYTGPRGGRITTAILRDATHWDEVVTTLGFEYLRRHDLRHTGLTWMADAGVPLHVLRLIAGHADLKTTQLYLQTNAAKITAAGRSLSAHLRAARSPNGPQPGLR